MNDIETSRFFIFDYLYKLKSLNFTKKLQTIDRIENPWK